MVNGFLTWERIPVWSPDIRSALSAPAPAARYSLSDRPGDADPGKAELSAYERSHTQIQRLTRT